MSDNIRKMVTDALGDPASLGMQHNAPYLLAVDNLVAALLAYGQSREAEATEREGPKIKPLEWSAGHSAASPCGTYYVIPVDGEFAVSINAMTIVAKYLGRFGTLDYAKAAAQADYEARILPALVQP